MLSSPNLFLAAILATLFLIALGAFADARRWLNLKKVTPVADGLIVDDDLRLGKKGSEAGLDPEFLCRASSVLRAARAPEVQLHTLLEQVAHVPNDMSERDAFRTDATDQRVIDVDVRNERSVWHGSQVANAANQPRGFLRRLY
jgi:hypothetical protein